MRQAISFNTAKFANPSLTAADLFVFTGIVAILYTGIRLAFDAPEVIAGPDISLSFTALPWYTLFSVGRMTAAYFLSLLFSLSYGYWAAHSRNARLFLMPLLDVLQSVPILSFLPVVLLSLSSFLPDKIAAEAAAIVLIFTSQAWNMTFCFYQSLITVPMELREASAVFRLSTWLRFKTLELPFAAIGLLWNSMMSWAGGWFFLMASEIFRVGSRDFRLPGLGSYLQTAASHGDMTAVAVGVTTLVGVIVVLDQLVWQPLSTWAEKFKVEMVESEAASESWFLSILSRSWLVERLYARLLAPFAEWFDQRFVLGKTEWPPAPEPSPDARPLSWFARLVLLILALGVSYGGYLAVLMLATIPLTVWPELFFALFATFLRVTASLLIALVWTVPLGVAIGSNRWLAARLQPIVQVVASVPATALFPVVLLTFLRLPGGLDLAAVGLMLMGTQWYLLFNIIAGASAIPQDLRDTTDLMRLPVLERWRTLILPALFPYVITGSIAASGGAWNASIVAEYVEFGGKTHVAVGIGAFIAQATSRGDFPQLLASTLLLVFTVVFINRTFWARMYRVAEERYRME